MTILNTSSRVRASWQDKQESNKQTKQQSGKTHSRRKEGTDTKIRETCGTVHGTVRCGASHTRIRPKDTNEGRKEGLDTKIRGTVPYGASHTKIRPKDTNQGRKEGMDTKIRGTVPDGTAHTKIRSKYPATCFTATPNDAKEKRVHIYVPGYYLQDSGIWKKIQVIKYGTPHLHKKEMGDSAVTIW